MNVSAHTRARDSDNSKLFTEFFHNHEFRAQFWFPETNGLQNLILALFFQNNNHYSVKLYKLHFKREKCHSNPLSINDSNINCCLNFMSIPQKLTYCSVSVAQGSTLSLKQQKTTITTKTHVANTNLETFYWLLEQIQISRLCCLSLPLWNCHYMYRIEWDEIDFKEIVAYKKYLSYEIQALKNNNKKVLPWPESWEK